MSIDSLISDSISLQNKLLGNLVPHNSVLLVKCGGGVSSEAIVRDMGKRRFEGSREPKCSTIAR